MLRSTLSESAVSPARPPWADAGLLVEILFPFCFSVPPQQCFFIFAWEGGGEMLISACCLHMFFLALSLSLI